MPPKKSTKVSSGPSNGTRSSASGASTGPSTSKYFIEKRLQLIVSPDKKKRIKKASLKSRRAKGKHEFLNFVDFPLDIVYEISHYLHPRDLLTLSRLSKNFHAFFLSRDTKYVWQRALSTVNKLPPCPEDLCEPQYASLLFGDFCMVSTVKTLKAVNLMYEIKGMREHKSKSNLGVHPEAETMRWVHQIEEEEADEDILALVPAGTKNLGFWDEDDDYSTEINFPKLTYFKPELHAMHDKMSGLRAKQAREFASAQTKIASRMMNEGFAMKAWEADMALEQELAINEIKDRHATRLKEEMLKIGWEEKYFPVYRDKFGNCDWDNYCRWEKLMNLPVEFTKEEWDNIFPLLEALYLLSKHKHRRAELLERIAFKYIKFRASQPLEKKRFMPGLQDIVEPGNFFCDFLSDNYWEGCSEDKLDAFMSEIMSNSQQFPATVQNDLVAMILKYDSSQPQDPEILNKAANIFLCGCRRCWSVREDMDLKVVKPYPEVIDHVMGVDETLTAVDGWTTHKICVEPLVLQAARDILEALGLSPDSTRDDVEKLGKLECRCGHYAYSDVALTFQQLVEHLFQERKWNQRMEKRVAEKSKHLVSELLQDGHSLDHLKTLVGIAPPESLDFDEEGWYSRERDMWGRVIPTVYGPPELPCPHICRSCYQLTLLAWPYRDSQAHYHIKTKHGRDRQDDDFAPLSDLVDEYGGNDWDDQMATGCTMPLDAYRYSDD